MKSKINIFRLIFKIITNPISFVKNLCFWYRVDKRKRKEYKKFVKTRKNNDKKWKIVLENIEKEPIVIIAETSRAYLPLCRDKDELLLGECKLRSYLELGCSDQNSLLEETLNEDDDRLLSNPIIDGRFEYQHIINENGEETAQIIPIINKEFIYEK